MRTVRKQKQGRKKEAYEMIWYPYQQMKTMKEPYKIIDAQGVWLKTPEREMIDLLLVERDPWV